MKNGAGAFILRFAALGAIVALAAYLRFVNLRVNPGWYPDEGSNIDVALNLLDGRYQYFAVGGSALLEGRPPLFHLLLAGTIQLFGRDILMARSIAAVTGCIVVLLLYFASRRMLDEPKAWLSAFIFAILPDAVLFNRFGFSYNLLMPLFILCAWAMYEFLETRRAKWWILASISAGLALITDLVAFPLLFCLVLVFLLSDRKIIFPSLLVALFPMAIYFAVMLILAPQPFLEDLNAIAFRTGYPVLHQFSNLIVGYELFLEVSIWNVLGVVGLFLIASRRSRLIVLLVFFATLFNLLRVAPPQGRGFYRFIELLPFIALGLSALLARIVPYALELIASDADAVLAGVRRDGSTFPAHQLSKALLVDIAVFLTIASPFAAVLLNDFIGVQTELRTQAKEVISARTTDALAAADFVNANVQRDDVVLLSPQIAWRVRANVADFQQSLAAQGIPTENFPLPISRSRFVFDPSYTNAKFVIVDDFWRRWGVETMPEMRSMLTIIGDWQVVFRVGEYVVYRNPAR